jgi:hypothetical protein
MRLVSLIFLFNAAVQVVIIDANFSSEKSPFRSGIELLIAQMLGNLLLAECLWFTAPIPAECRAAGLLTTRLWLIPWDEITSYRSREKPPALFVVRRHTTLEVSVAPEDLAPMEALLAERVR